MGDMSWKRARTTHQKEERIKVILSAAASLFHSLSFDKVSILLIAKESGFTRSNIYRYFKTKEEIFLELYIEDVIEWKHQIVNSFVGDETPEEFVNIWVEILIKQKRLLELTPLLALNLEKNSSELIYFKTKKRIYKEVEEVGKVISDLFPNLDYEGIIQFLIIQHALVAGLSPMCKYNDMQEKVLKENNLNNLKLDFIKHYRSSILSYFNGLLLKQSKF